MQIQYLGFFISFMFSQHDISDWSTITSFLNPTGMVVHDNGMVYVSTSGGLLEFDKHQNEFNFMSLEDGLIYLDLSTISKDDHGRLWLGSSYPRGYLQVFEPGMGLVRFFEDDLISSIKNIIIGQNVAFSVYEGVSNSELGILKFELDELGLPEYKDYYNDISEEIILEIHDLDMFLDSIYVTTDKGLFVGCYSDNLKFSHNWYK